MQGVEFLGFAGDCTITGRITMFGERLTDFLNGQERFLLHKVEFESLEDGRRVPVDSVSVEREDLLAVVHRPARLRETARAPRGSSMRPRRSRRRRSARRSR